MRMPFVVCCLCFMLLSSLLRGGEPPLGTLSIDTVQGDCRAEIAVGLNLTPTSTSLTFLSVVVTWDRDILRLSGFGETPRTASLFATEVREGQARIDFFDLTGQAAIIGGDSPKILDLLFTCTYGDFCGMTPVRISRYEALQGTQSVTLMLEHGGLRPEVVIDDGDIGTARTGRWHTSSGDCPYGEGSLYSRSPGSTYSYTREVSPLCLYEVAIWSSEYPSRCTEVLVTVWDGNALLHSARIDQRNLPCQWNVLGTFLFPSGLGKVVVEAQRSDCSTCADAVRFRNAGAAPTPEELTITPVGEPCAGRTYRYSCHVTYDDGSTRELDPCSVTWELDCPDAAAITACGELRAFQDSAGKSCTITARYTEMGTPLQAEANVVFIECPCPEETVIIDNGERGTSSQGSWNPSSGSCPYGAGSLFSRTRNSSYSYTYGVLPGCRYEISLWSSRYHSRCTEVPVQIWEGGNLLATVPVDQLHVFCQWNSLGTYTFRNGPARVVILVDDTDCSTCADAVRFQSRGAPAELASLQIQGPEQVCEGSRHAYRATAVYSDGSTRELDPCVCLWGADCPGVADVIGCGEVRFFAGSAPAECTLRAQYTEGAITAQAELDISVAVCPCEEVILVIDNGMPGTEPIGSWNLSSGSCPFGSDSLYSRSPSSRYVFRAELPSNCPHQVSLWSSQWPSRCTSVPVEVWDGDRLLETVPVNQQRDYCKWNVLGTYLFLSGEARIVVVANSSACSTCADAVRFGRLQPGELVDLQVLGTDQPCEGRPTQYNVEAYWSDGTHSLLDPCAVDWFVDPPQCGTITQCGQFTPAEGAAGTTCTLQATYQGFSGDLNVTVVQCGACPEVTIDNGDPGTEQTGTWLLSSGTCPFGPDSLYSKTPGSTYTFRYDASGCAYTVSLRWSQWHSRCTQVPVDLYDGATLLGSFIVNQRTTPCAWVPLGTYVFGGEMRLVIHATSTACSTCADAVRLRTPSKALSYAVENPEGDIREVPRNDPVILFRRGDVNGDGRLNVSDCTSLVRFLFAGAPQLPCADAADLDDSGTVSSADALLLVAILFGHAEESFSGPVCEGDHTEDNLPCSSYEFCE